MKGRTKLITVTIAAALALVATGTGATADSAATCLESRRRSSVPTATT